MCRSDSRKFGIFLFHCLSRTHATLRPPNPANSLPTRLCGERRGSVVDKIGADVASQPPPPSLEDEQKTPQVLEQVRQCLSRAYARTCNAHAHALTPGRRNALVVLAPTPLPTHVHSASTLTPTPDRPRTPTADRHPPDSGV